MSGASPRLFLGVRLEPAAAAALAAISARIRRRAEESGLIGARWVAPPCFHVTLAFLGPALRAEIAPASRVEIAPASRAEIAPALRAEIAASVDGAAGFELELAGLGAFPEARRARVLWAGIGGGRDALTDLAARAVAAATRQGFELEERPYRPHVTLARVRPPSDFRAVIGASEQIISTSRVDAVILFDSSKKTEESGYAELASWPLASALSRPHRHT